MNLKTFDCVIFGASGFVGKFTVLEAIEILKDLKWAIAGRSKQKLELVLEEISYKTDKDLSNIPILIANGSNVEDLKELMEQCKVLINCCGPSQLLAENILTTCILNGTHYVDMCNDPYFNELMELKYHEKAEANNVYVVSSCGFQSFAIDMALNYLRQNFNGTINHVDAYVRYNFLNDFYLPTIYPLWSGSSWFSLLWSCSKVVDLPQIRRELRQKPELNLLPKQPIEELLQRSKYHEKGFMVHFPFIDQQVVERSQYLCYAEDNLRPIQFYKYIEFPSLLIAFLFIFWCLILSILSQFVKTRNFILNHPKLFSFGTFSSNGPDEYIVEMTSYKITLNASGWSKRISASETTHNNVLNQFMNVEVYGRNPFYGCGCLFLLLSARTILEESATMPGSGGVYPPGFAFQKTNILEKLEIFKNFLHLRIL